MNAERETIPLAEALDAPFGVKLTLPDSARRWTYEGVDSLAHYSFLGTIRRRLPAKLQQRRLFREARRGKEHQCESAGGHP